MVQKTTTVTLTQLVDLALNGPETGVINFNMLHTLLHCLIQIMDRNGIQVEFQGNDSDRIENLLAVKKEGPPLNLTEYVIKPGDTERKKLKKNGSKTKRISLKESLSKDDVQQKAKEEGGETVITEKGSLQRIIVVEATQEGSSVSAIPTVAITKLHFEQVETDLEVLKTQIKELTELPGNMGLVEALKSGDSGAPVLEMFQILNLCKRMEANEQGVEKMASIIEDFAREHVELSGTRGSKEVLDKVETLRASMEVVAQPAQLSKVESIERRVVELEKVIKEGVPATVETEIKPPPERKESDADDTSSRKQRKSVDSGRMSFSSSTKLNKLPTTKAMTIIQQELEKINNLISSDLIKDVADIKEKLNPGETASDLPPAIRINLMETKFQETVEQLNALDLNYNEQMTAIQSQINNIGKGGGVDDEAIAELYTKLNDLDKEIQDILDVIGKLQQDKQEKQDTMDAMVEQLDLLKIVKADREDLEEALGDKADSCAINRKVSIDKFDAACDDLNRMIEEAVGKLEEQERMWLDALDNIQKEIGHKLDKEDVDPLREFVNSKLKMLQDKVKALAQLKKEREAAGSKSKYLRDVNCISCDKDVVMRRQMDTSLKPRAPAAQPTRSMAPYLAYELDQLRKQQKQGSKNVNYLESAMRFNKQSKDVAKEHLCNRYCGGSHTVTTPQQRVARVGHFLEQWGPEIQPLEDEYIKGNDNRMYKSRDDGAALRKLSQKGRSSSAGIVPGKLETVPEQTQDLKQVGPAGGAGATEPADSRPRPSGESIKVNADARETLVGELSKTQPKQSVAAPAASEMVQDEAEEADGVREAAEEEAIAGGDAAEGTAAAAEEEMETAPAAEATEENEEN